MVERNTSLGRCYFMDPIHHLFTILHGTKCITFPFSQKGRVKDRFELRMDLEGHFCKGDKTQDVFLDCYLPFVKNKIALEFYGVPVEHYKMDEPTVIERRGRNRSGEGFATGDFYFSTIIQVIKNKKIPDIALRMACKTASGSQLSDARNTDAPGYFFDLSLGKDLMFTDKFIHKIRISWNDWFLFMANEPS